MNCVVCSSVVSFLSAWTWSSAVPGAPQLASLIIRSNVLRGCGGSTGGRDVAWRCWACLAPIDYVLSYRAGLRNAFIETVHLLRNVLPKA